ILPHQPYISPPPQNKHNFNLETPLSFAEVMNQLYEKKPQASLWQALVETFAGVSPQLAREIAYRLAERKGFDPAGMTLATFQDWEYLYDELRTLLSPLNPALSKVETFAWLVREPEGKVMAFAPYELHQFRSVELEPEAVESLSQAAEEFYSQVEAVGGQSQRKQEIAAKVGEYYDKLRRRAASLEGSLKKAESAEELKRKGEAIYAHLYELTPGQSLLEAEGLKISLDPDRTPSDNAQAYFRDYDKARQAQAGVPELLAATRLELEYLDEMLTQLDLAESYDEIMNLKAELGEAGYGPKEKEKGHKSPRPKRRKLPQTPSFTSPEGFTIFVGKSAQHNEYVTFELGDRNDVWLHARGMPGSHVIIKTQGRDVPEKTLEMAATLAAYYSKGQTSTKVEVTYAPQRYVRKVKGSHPGLVTYSNDQSLNVKPQKLK
ncbi:MAG: NFACT RNA binding domain-containing protein, partial [Chloroflexota bacterium]